MRMSPDAIRSWTVSAGIWRSRSAWAARSLSTGTSRAARWSSSAPIVDSPRLTAKLYRAPLALASGRWYTTPRYLAVLSEEQNRTLTEVGAGTRMGELLRRYWMPIAAVAELDDHPTKPVRLLGENLVLYKDRSGNYGLVDR